MTTTINIPVHFEAQGVCDESVLILNILNRLNNNPEQQEIRYYFDNKLYCECSISDEHLITTLKKISQDVDSAFQIEAGILHELNNTYLGYDTGTPYVTSINSITPEYNI